MKRRDSALIETNLNGNSLRTVGASCGHYCPYSRHVPVWEWSDVTGRPRQQNLASEVSTFLEKDLAPILIRRRPHRLGSLYILLVGFWFRRSGCNGTDLSASFGLSSEELGSHYNPGCNSSGSSCGELLYGETGRQHTASGPAIPTEIVIPDFCGIG